jgi:N-acetylglucosaminyl-diphospho-decaprenol L-rhamnosyltransferase
VSRPERGIPASVPGLSVIVVAHDSLADLRRTLPALTDELGAGDEVIVVDSGSSDGLASELPGLVPAARLVTAPGNVGFAAGVNLGAARATGELIVLLNPDARVQAGWGQAIRALWGGEWAAWMGLVTMDGGAAINTSGGVLHITGLGWAGQAGEPIAAAPSSVSDVGFLSGACLAVPRQTWAAAGGFSEQFFMYCEDVDLSLRLRLRGGRLAVDPRAVVIHDYDFDKGLRKWRLLERNRWATILRTYPAPLLALAMPALIATELGIWLTALRGGWALMKALATLDTARALPRLARERRAIQATREIDAAEFAAALTDQLSSVYLGGLARNPLARTAVGLYWRAVRFLLRAPAVTDGPATDTTRL